METMKKDLNFQEAEQIRFWNQKSQHETFEILDWVGIKEQNDFFKFANVSGRLNVLEIGAGTGRWTISLLQRGLKVTATDISSKSLGVLKEKAQRLNLEKKLEIICDNFEKPLFKSCFDAVFCFGVIHHFDPNKRNLILKNIAISLKKGGSIYILEPNPLNPLFYLIYFWRWLNNSQGLNRWSTEKGFLRSNIWNLKKSLKKMGISEIENKWYGYLPSRFANYVPFVLELNKLLNTIPFCKLFSAYIWIKGKKD